jgi:Schlafen, AlbA_2
MVELPWEDSLLERKVESDLKDLLKTVVAFANSVRPGHIATILIGEMDDGTIKGVTNPDSIQKTVRKECEKIYPPILWRSQVYKKDSKPCVRVEIEYSGETPHFGGPAWVRKGTESITASDEVFQRLIEFRSSKIRELAKWLGKEISIGTDSASVPHAEGPIWTLPIRWAFSANEATLCSVSNFWATFEVKSNRYSEPLEKLILSWDNRIGRLKILVKL